MRVQFLEVVWMVSVGVDGTRGSQDIAKREMV
jgi:hypothetical protein